MDEFDSIYFDNDSPSPDRFYDFLCTLLQNKNIKLVVVLGRDPDELPESAKRLLGGSQRIHISLMTEAEVNDIINLSKKMLKWSSNARKEIWSLTRGHPLIVQ